MLLSLRVPAYEGSGGEKHADITMYANIPLLGYHSRTLTPYGVRGSSSDRFYLAQSNDDYHGTTVTNLCAHEGFNESIFGAPKILRKK